MPAPQRIKELIDRFHEKYWYYQSKEYNEEQLRTEFLNPFFEELGWDMENKAGKGADRNVHYEKRIKAGAPDFGFYLDNKLRFFVEAKNPSKHIAKDASAALQLRTYGWSAKVSRSILSDFEEFAIYDTTVRPKSSDRPHEARLECIKYTEYVERWDEIVSLFSREAVVKGSLEKLEKKRTKQAVDAGLLEDISRWREALAKMIALRNEGLSEEQVNRAVQDTLDRLIFLRICEDRGIETENRLREAAEGTGVYANLFKIFKKAQQRYDSGLFDLKPPAADLVIDDKTLAEIISELYFPKSPYKFDAIPAEILGQVYEQFLGKVIRLTENHHAKVEEKPEVRKAGGVYYTPTYIVEYIVKNTIGKLVEGKSPKDIATLSILDPACGSGSFLIGAYQYLMDWYGDWYVAHDVKKHEKAKLIYRDADGAWQLTLAERRRILLAHIYGVDIDRQAVEVAKLSLMLKTLEAPEQQSLFNERILPDLSSNIKCGNSLIGTDYFSGQMMTDPAEMARINPFDWDGADGFQEIMKRGGFDAVIGNPPYGYHEIHSDNTKPYLKKHYTSSSGSFEHYFLFYEAGLNKLRRDGYHGFIVPVTWLMIPSAQSLRKFILSNYALEKIIWLPALVFKNAQVNTLVSIIRNAKPGVTKILISDANDPALNEGSEKEVEQTKFVSAGYKIHIFESEKETNLLTKIETCSIPLGSLARPCSGYNPYEVGTGLALDGRPHTLETVKNRPYHSSTKLGKDWKPEVAGHDLERYYLKWPEHSFVKYGPWLAAARDPGNFIGSRLLVQEITGGSKRRIIATFCKEELYHSRDVIPVKCGAGWPHPLFLLGVVNSWLITWRHHRRSPKAKKALFPKVLVSDLKQIPIPKLTENNLEDKSNYDSLIRHVEKMLSLNKSLHENISEAQRDALSRQIDATDRQIDQLVYKLYGLTEEEIKIVEEGVKK